MHAVHRAALLPLEISDLSRSDAEIEAALVHLEHPITYVPDAAANTGRCPQQPWWSPATLSTPLTLDAQAKGEKMATVNRDTRLDNRVIDLRTPANQVADEGAWILPRAAAPLQQDCIVIESTKIAIDLKPLHNVYAGDLRGAVRSVAAVQGAHAGRGLCGDPHAKAHCGRQ